MNDYAKIFKAFVCPYLAVFFGSCIGFRLAIGGDMPPLLLVIFVGVLAELGFEFGIIPVVKAKRKAIPKQGVDPACYDSAESWKEKEHD